MLKNRKITVAVTGGIAAYKACEVVRGLIKLGADVRVAMTENATRFVGPVTFEALSGHPVATTEWEHTPEGAMPHIELNLHADLLLVVPATANILAKAARGIADDLVSALILAHRSKVAFVPAMNCHMWRNPATQRNVEDLKRDGAQLFVGVHGVGVATRLFGEFEKRQIVDRVREGGFDRHVFAALFRELLHFFFEKDHLPLLIAVRARHAAGEFARRVGFRGRRHEVLDPEELRDGFGDEAVRARCENERATALAPLLEIIKHHGINVGRHLFAHEFVAPGFKRLSRIASEKPHGEAHHFVEREGARMIFAVEPSARFEKFLAQARLFDQKDGPAVSRVDRQKRVVEVKYGQFHVVLSPLRRASATLRVASKTAPGLRSVDLSAAPARPRAEAGR